MIQVIQPFGLDMSCEAVTEKSVSEHMNFYELKYSNRKSSIDISMIPCFTTEWIVCYNNRGDACEFVCIGALSSLTAFKLNAYDNYLGVRFDETGCYFNQGCDIKTYPVNIFNQIFSYSPKSGSHEKALVDSFRKSSSFEERIELFTHFLMEHKTFCPVPDNIRMLNDSVTSGVTTVQEMSVKSGYSERHISRLYREVYGFGPKDFIKYIRFQNVLQAIIDNPESDNSVFIAGTGYSDQAHFQREFKSYTGITPKQFARTIASR